MNIENLYDLWVSEVSNPELKRDLLKIKDNENEKYDRFNKFLEFGTAGIRAVMGAGTNRLNIYTIRKISQGLAQYLLKKTKNPSVAISYDSRNKSKLFAYTSAEVMAANNIKVYITCKLEPTPFLSFAVRNLKCSAGIMITASHNTKEYNGYKCYGSDGAQITEITAEKICEEISKVDIFSGIKKMKIQDGLSSGIISFMDESLAEDYLRMVTTQRINTTDISKLKVIYTPLNGSGMCFVCQSLKKIGVKNLTVVQKQKYPDGNFTTCPYPNPELPSAFEYALKAAKKNNADLILATDPDADRLGVCIRNRGKYDILSGNQIGILLFYYIVKRKKEFIDFTKRPIVIKTIVSSKAINSIAKKEGCSLIEVATGFKNIANEISKLEKENKLPYFIFAMEESNGYLCESFVRDKDAISAAVLICEATAYFKNNGLTLMEALSKVYAKYGYYGEKTLGFEFVGSKAKEKIEKLISNFKTNTPKYLGDYEIKGIKDYSYLYSTEIISFDLGDENEVIIRPSGTEPKLKVYILAHEKNEKSLSQKLEVLENVIKTIVNEFENSKEESQNEI